MKILQINVLSNSGSTGRIAEGIGLQIIENENESYIAFGRGLANESKSQQIKIGNTFDQYLHVLKTRLTDKHGFGSKKITKKFIETIKKINPDIIHLHNIHGYYINVEVLFNFLKEYKKPIVWTLHDCWPFTGHCAYYMQIDCSKWQTQCYKCPIKNSYPKSFYDNSKNNYKLKKELFTGIKNMHIVTPSNWLAGEVKKSFLQDYPISVINNGINLNQFNIQKKETTKELVSNSFSIIGVANIWDERKGFSDFIKLRQLLGEEFEIILIGLSQNQIDNLPSGIKGIQKTESVYQLAEYYSKADVFLNPTYEDNFPTTNIEAIACGTPVITYDTGGSPESVDFEGGFVVSRGDLDSVVKIIKHLKISNISSEICRSRAVKLYDSKQRFNEYIKLYENLYNLK